jgi:L-seryl-tRNA(Ser) seleniumtransferase
MAARPSFCDDEHHRATVPVINNSGQSAIQNQPDLYRLLPGVNDVLQSPPFAVLLVSWPRPRVVDGVRALLASLRLEIAAGAHSASSLHQALDQLAERVAAGLAAPRTYSLRPVINASGVLLHTNMGRAPLSESAIRHIAEIAAGYCNLELDLETGSRSRREIHVESLLLHLLELDPEHYAAAIVNNCAAATWLALNSLAEKREVLVSRGELVEIGGGFRIPEILEKSGALLKEIGTTNRTRASDYERALSPATALILRVHRSNFSIEGFTEQPALEELVALAARAGVPVFEDQGTGLLASLERYGIRNEPVLAASFARGVDLVAASGDKLLGGPQCGLLIGRIDLTQKIQKNPMMRALRVDKLTYAALEATLLDYLSGDSHATPLHRMLAIRPEELMQRCQHIAGQVQSSQLAIEVVPVESLVGGGTAPKASLPSCALALHHATLSADQLLSALRRLDSPIIARITDNAVHLDLRTVPESFDTDLIRLLHLL